MEQEARVENMRRAHIYVSGRVQGVFYRHNTQMKARELGLTGWVRNTEGGQVEVLAEGEEGRVEELIAWCRKGPPASRVDRVEVKEEMFTGEFRDFSVRLW